MYPTTEKVCEYDGTISNGESGLLCRRSEISVTKGESLKSNTTTETLHVQSMLQELSYSIQSVKALDQLLWYKTI